MVEWKYPGAFLGGLFAMAVITAVELYYIGVGTRARQKYNAVVVRLLVSEPPLFCLFLFCRRSALVCSCLGFCGTPCDMCMTHPFHSRLPGSFAFKQYITYFVLLGYLISWMPQGFHGIGGSSA